MAYTSRERVIAALDLREPDRIPISFGCLHDSIHVFGHRKLMKHLGIRNGDERIQDPFQQNVFPNASLLERFGSDCLPLYAKAARPFEMRYYIDGGFRKYRDEWGTVYRQPLEGGIWFDFESTIWAGKSAQEIRKHKLPDPRCMMLD